MCAHSTSATQAPAPFSKSVSDSALALSNWKEGRKRRKKKLSDMVVVRLHESKIAKAFSSILIALKL